VPPLARPAWQVYIGDMINDTCHANVLYVWVLITCRFSTSHRFLNEVLAVQAGCTKEVFVLLFLKGYKLSTGNIVPDLGARGIPLWQHQYTGSVN
jgi:hypothetical protein